MSMGFNGNESPKHGPLLSIVEGNDKDLKPHIGATGHGK